MQSINFGRIEDLEIRDGEPIFDPLPRVYRTIKLSGMDGPHRQISADDFILKDEIAELFSHFDRIGNAVIPLIDVRHGLPLVMEFEEVSLI